jgi:hypothetical protein
LTHKSSSNNLLKVRKHATNKAISIATQTAGLILHPDLPWFKQWLLDTQLDAHYDVAMQAQEKLGLFTNTLLQK